jgi:hypothetical protein
VGRCKLEWCISGRHAPRNEARRGCAKIVRAILVAFPGAMLCAFAMPSHVLADASANGNRSNNPIAESRSGVNVDSWTSPLWPCPAFACGPHPACGCCPDDYCRKPLPAVCPPRGTTCDTYCRKPMPGVPCLPPACSADCYRVKPFPPCPRVCEPWYTCGKRPCRERPRDTNVGSASADAGTP